MPASHSKLQRQSLSLPHTRYRRGRLPCRATPSGRAIPPEARQRQRGTQTSLRSRPNTPPEQTGKRLLDLAIAIPALLLFAPLLALIALAVRLDTPGPALFRQTRTGKGRRQFVILKFRTMQPGIEGRRAPASARHITLDSGGATGSSPHDFSARLRAIQANATTPGITRTGRLLRASRLDELPQLLNVLRGDMSLVGPRPHMPDLDALFAPALPHIYRRYAVRPGMTGLAQISGACGPTPDVPAMGVRLGRDLAYLRDWSLAGDLRLLFATPWRLLVSGVSENEVGAPFGAACQASWQIPNRRRQRQARILSAKVTSPFRKGDTLAPESR